MTTKYQCKVNSNTGNLLTCEFRVAGPFTFHTPKADDRGVLKYGLRALFPVDADLSVLKRMVEDKAIDKFGQSYKTQGLRLPFRDQGEKGYEGYTPGAVFVNLTAWEKPGLVDADGGPIVDERDFYAGCWARASLQAYPYTATGNKGVGLKMVNVQKLWDDEPLSGEATPEADFEPVAQAKGVDDLLS